MSRAWIPVVTLAATLAAGTAAAQPTSQVVYVSNFSGGQVLAVETATSSTAVALSRALVGSDTFSPGDMVVGPDGDLYICDSLNGLVWRLEPGEPVVPSLNPVVVAAFGPGVYPEGPSFSGSDDLYVNTRGFGTAATGGTGATGVWVVRRVAEPGVSIPIAPQQVIPSIGAAGEGTSFAAPGHLLAVDSSANRVVAAKPVRGPFPQYGPSFAPLITSNLSAPTGIAVNTCGDLLVSSGTAIQRFSVVKNPATGNLSAQYRNAYVTFARGEVVTFFERDAANVLWVNTNSATAGGKVWRIAPATGTGGDPIAACTSGVLPAAPLVSLKALSQGSAAILTNRQLQAVGLAVPAGDFTAAAKTFSPASPSQTWNFGHYSIRLEYKQVFTTFAQSFSAMMSRPEDVTFASGTFASGTAGTRYPSLGGSVIQFRTLSPAPGCTSYAQCGAPVAGTDFAVSTAADPAFRLILFSSDPLQGFTDPGVAHASDDSVTGLYTDDYTSDVWVGTEDPRGGTGNNFGSKFVSFDRPFGSTLALPLSVTLNQPALSGNPLFNFGQNFTVSITVRDANGATVPGLRVRLSALRFSPAPFFFETVRSTNGSAQLNFLNDNGNGKYSIGVDTGLFRGGPGTYQFTLFGSGFAPFQFYAVFQR